MKIPTGFGLPAIVEGESQPRDENAVDLRETLRVLRRHKWTIVGTIVLVVAMAILTTSQLDRKYSAEALVVVDRRDSQLVGFDTGLSQGLGSSSVVDTEVEIARSGKVLQRVAIELDLASSMDLSRRSWLDRLEFWRDAPTTGLAPREFSDLTAEEQTEVVNRLSRALDTTRRGLTNVISIRATAGSAQDAANRANAVAAAYLDEQIASRLDSAERAVKFLRSRVEGLARDISEGEAAVDRFVSTQLEKLDSPAARELLARIEAEHQSRLTSEAAFADLQNALREQDFERLVQLTEMPADIARQRQSLAQELQGSAIRVDLDQTRRQLADLDRQIREAAEKRVSSLQVDMSLSDSRAANFRKQLESTLANQRLPAVVVNELDRLQRDVETRRSLYDSFLAKLRQVEQQTGFNMPDSRIIANATPPPYPSFPPTRLILAGAVLFSLGAGIGLAFLRENYLGGITDIEQFEAIAGIPVVASVPHIAGAHEKTHLAIVEDPLSAFSEAIRRISTGIRGPTSSGKLCVFVTSTLPGDGKTTIAVALARQFALTGSSALMVDADLRHPSVHRLLNKDAGDGLIGLLSRDDGSVVDQLIVTQEAASNVHFVIAGDAGGVATDTLLMSRRFDELMKFARQTYDVVVIDTPPVGLVVDAAIVARHCDAGVFIAHYHSTMPQQVRASMRDLLLRAAGVPLYGVLNQVAWADSQVYGYGEYYRSRR